MEEILTSLGVNSIPVVLAGAIGGTVSLRRKEDLSVRSRVFIVLGSIALANYLTAPIILYFGSEAIEFKLGIAAGIGLFGLTIVSSITDIISDTVFWQKCMRGFFPRD